LGRFISADTVVPGSAALTLWPGDGVAAALWATDGGGPQNPQALNRYSYVENNPITQVDPTGHWLERAVDIAFIAADVYDISQNGLNWENGLALAADVAGLALPVVTGGGLAVRAAMHADDAVDALKAADKAADAVRTTDTTTDATRSVTNGLCSFTPDTPVATPDGAVPIAAIAVGDMVFAYNEATGATGVYTVTATWGHLDPLIVALTLDDDTLTTTPEHPFFVLRRGWVAAADLRPGDAVRRVDGTYGLVTRVALEARPQVMYNLTVATAHTFFVGDDGWLVHNDCGDYIGPNRQIPAGSYPSINDPRTGNPIPFPEGNLVEVNKADRVPWGREQRGEYIREWHKRGYSTPPGGWGGYDIHHIKPREFGGTNDFDNLVSVPRNRHREFNTFWREWD
jgi:hypothetical protein